MTNEWKNIYLETSGSKRARGSDFQHVSKNLRHFCSKKDIDVEESALEIFFNIFQKKLFSAVSAALAALTAEKNWLFHEKSENLINFLFFEKFAPFLF